jgi:hypothetical protein
MYNLLLEKEDGSGFDFSVRYIFLFTDFLKAAPEYKLFLFL